MKSHSSGGLIESIYSRGGLVNRTAPCLPWCHCATEHRLYQPERWNLLTCYHLSSQTQNELLQRRVPPQCQGKQALMLEWILNLLAPHCQHGPRRVGWSEWAGGLTSLDFWGISWRHAKHTQDFCCWSKSAFSLPLRHCASQLRMGDFFQLINSAVNWS